MKTCKLMQEVITKIAQKHGVDLDIGEAYLPLEMENYEKLVIENVGVNQVSVAHYFKQNGDLIADPEIVFFTGYDEWVPIEVTQVVGGWRRYAELSPDAEKIVLVNPRGQAELTSFANLWARNIKAQGWLEDGKPAW